MNTGSGIIDIITSALGTILYPLFSIVFVLIDAVQNIFYAFAGIGNSGITFVDTTVTNANDGGETTTGVLYYLFQQPVIRNLLLSIMLLALLLIVIFTVMAFIKNTYSPKPKTWTEIVGNALKGLANFIFLPVCCLLGVWGGNILLGAINGATSNGGSADMSRKLFIACAYNANYFRTGYYKTSDYKNIWDIANSAGGCTVTGDSKESITEFTITITNGDDKVVINVKPDMTAEQYAQIVDQIYSESQISIHWQWSVGGAYSLWQFNYLLLIIGGVFMLYVLGSLAFAMVRRLFILLALFVISPALCAMYPLDEGTVVGQWKKKFIGETISAYGAVAGMNIFFSIVPIVDKIRVFTGAGSIVNEIFRIFILVVGLFCVKEIIGLISGYVGGENAYEKGSGLMKSTKETVKKHTVGTAKKVAGGAFAIKTAVDATKDKQHLFGKNDNGQGHGKVRSFASSLLNSATGGLSHEFAEGFRQRDDAGNIVGHVGKGDNQKKFGDMLKEEFDALGKRVAKIPGIKEGADEYKNLKEKDKASKELSKAVSEFKGDLERLIDLRARGQSDSPEARKLLQRVESSEQGKLAMKQLNFNPEEYKDAASQLAEARKQKKALDNLEKEKSTWSTDFGGLMGGFSISEVAKLSVGGVRASDGISDAEKEAKISAIEKAREIQQAETSAAGEMQKSMKNMLADSSIGIDSSSVQSIIDSINSNTDSTTGTISLDSESIDRIGGFLTDIKNSYSAAQDKLAQSIKENFDKFTKEINKKNEKK